jgi:hypothetical protein
VSGTPSRLNFDIHIRLLVNSVYGEPILSILSPSACYLTFCSLVPPQTPETIAPLIRTYIQAEFDKLGSKNTLVLEELHGGKPWVADINHWNFAAAKAATQVE